VKLREQNSNEAPSMDKHQTWQENIVEMWSSVSVSIREYDFNTQALQTEFTQTAFELRKVTEMMNDDEFLKST